MTDFVGFFETGVEILTGSNYFVLNAITDLNWDNLKVNIGFIVSIAYSGSYLLLSLLLNCLDRQKLKHNYYE